MAPWSRKDEVKYNMDSQSRDGSPVEKLEEAVPGYGHARNEHAVRDVEEDENPNVFHHVCHIRWCCVGREMRTVANASMQMCPKLFLSLVAMSFCWVGSQIPLYLFGSVLPDIYTDVGGAMRYQWMVIGYLIPNAALCPFVGNLSDMFGRRWVAVGGQFLLVIGPIVTSTAYTMNTAIGKSPPFHVDGFLQCDD